MSDYLGRFFAGLIPILLILVMVVVIGRYFFGIGRVDIQELALYVHALIFLGCAGWAYSADEHVRVPGDMAASCFREQFLICVSFPSIGSRFGRPSAASRGGSAGYGGQGVMPCGWV